jgi:hypothetical protein
MESNRDPQATCLPNVASVVRLADQTHERGRPIIKGSKNENGSYNRIAKRRRAEPRKGLAAKGYEKIAKNGARDGARTRDLRRDRPAL